MRLGLGLLAFAHGALQLPVVDLAHKSWKEKALEALQSHASFLLTGHGLGNSSCGAWGEALEAARQLFALPLEEKKDIAASSARGYLAVGAESGTKRCFECKETERFLSS